MWSSNMGLVTADFYSTLGSKTVSRANYNYATAHNAATGTTLTSGTIVRNTRPSYYQISRLFYYFNTLSLDPNISIISADIVFKSNGKSETDPDHSDLILLEPVHGDTVVLADYGTLLPIVTPLATIPYEDIIADSSTEFSASLGSTALALINPGGITKYCLRMSGDVENLIPTGANVVGLPQQVAYGPPLIRITYKVKTWKGDVHVDQLKHQHVERMLN